MVKALSIRQPWAWLIANGHKDIENRTWPTRHRGTILIHASKGMTRDEYESAADLAFDCGVESMTPFEQMERGGIVGVATLSDCLRASDSPWHMPDCWGFRLTEARPLPFRPLSGRLGLFDVPTDVLGALAEELSNHTRK